MRARGLGLLIVGLVLFGVAWMFSTPPFQAPDEASHYLRAATLANGHLVGPRVPIDAGGEAMLRLGTWHAQEQRWIDHDRRGVFVTPALSPPGVVCSNDAPDFGKGCIEVSYTGDYSPLAFALPAVAISASHGWQPALWLSRAASLLPVLVFLGLALAFASRAGRWSVLGVLGAITPTVLFIGAALNPSGLEIGAALAFLSGLLELRGDPDRFPHWAWFGVILSGLVVILAWQLGLFFAVVYLVVWAMLIGRRGLGALFAGARARMLGGGIAFIVAGVLFVVYGLAYGSLHSSLSLSPLVQNLRDGRNEFTLTLRGAIGIFGAYNILLPSPTTLIWCLAVIALLGVAVWRGSRRERLLLGLVSAFGIAFPIVFYGFSYRYSGFGLQGRYVLPALALIPLLAGHVLDRRAALTPPASARRARYVAFTGFAIFQLVAWWTNAHHWAATSSLVLAHAGWRPPLGWWPWLLAAVLGTLPLLLAGLSDPRERKIGSDLSEAPATGSQPKR